MASFAGSKLALAKAFSIGLDGSGGIDQLQLIHQGNAASTSASSNGFGLWRMPSGISHPLAMHTSAKVGQTLVANTRRHQRR